MHSKEQITNGRPWGWFFFMVAISVPVGWRAVLKLWVLANSNDAYTHILLIVPIVAGLMYFEWPNARSSVVAGWRTGSIFLLAAVLVAGFGKWEASSLGSDVQLSIGTLAMVLWCIGAFIACFGTRVSRSLIFPLGFLLWLVPLPTAALDAIVAFLQRGSADAAQLLFNAVGVPVVQDGIRLSIPGLTVEVAQECSSIRSSMILLVTTMVLAQLFLRSPWRKAFVDAVVIPLSLAKNGLRIFTIAMLGTRVDPGFLNGKLHHNGGVIFLIIALAVIFLLLWILRDEKKTDDSTFRPVISAARK